MLSYVLKNVLHDLTGNEKMENRPPACMLLCLKTGRETGNLFGVA